MWKLGKGKFDNALGHSLLTSIVLTAVKRGARAQFAPKLLLKSPKNFFSLQNLTKFEATKTGSGVGFLSVGVNCLVVFQN